MSEGIKTKKSFGTAVISSFSPAVDENWPKAINMTLSFEEAMRLHLGLGQALGKLNSYNRSTKEGKESAICLCAFPEKRRITITETRI
jgi:hypothetical protein